MLLFNKKIIFLNILMFLGVFSSSSYAATSSPAAPIIIKGEVVIDKQVTYDGVNLDLSRGRFILKKNGELTIKNSSIQGVMSPQNPYLINITDGTLTLESNQVNIKAENIPIPPQAAVYFAINLTHGSFRINNNKFFVAPPRLVQLIRTDFRYKTEGLVFTNNSIEQFHGGLYLLNTEKANIVGNLFQKVSYANLVFLGSIQSVIAKNTFQFPGVFCVGDAIDIIDSSNIIVDSNKIVSDSCYGMQIMSGDHITLTNNAITDGITYAIRLTTSLTESPITAEFLKENAYVFKNTSNANIIISDNYFGQNRYGITGDNITSITIHNNYFVQRFQSSTDRKKFTDNNVLFTSVNYFKWSNNFYKEAYTQEPRGDNRRSNKFYNFPAYGGISISE